MIVPSRFYALLTCALVFLATLALTPTFHWFAPIVLVSALLTLVGIWDLIQKRHSIRRNYPLLAHFRFMAEYIRPEIRQYFIESDKEASTVLAQPALNCLSARQASARQASVRHD